jgi:hypothetical protein
MNGDSNSMNGDKRLRARNIQLTQSYLIITFFWYDIPEIFEKDNFYRKNFVVSNCKVNIEIEIARDVDNLCL